MLLELFQYNKYIYRSRCLYYKIFVDNISFKKAVKSRDGSGVIQFTRQLAC